MKARLVYPNVRNVTWIVKRRLAIRSGVKLARRGYYYIVILLSPHGVGKKNLEGLLGGKKVLRAIFKNQSPWIKSQDIFP